MAQVKITKIKSGIDRTERVKRTLLALGLTKTGTTKVVEATPSVAGMIAKVAHLLKVENV